MIINDTIAAISSGNINQAISIIRISGPDAVEIIKKIYNGKIGEDKTITYGQIIDNISGKAIDEVLVNFFIGTKNYVGEDTIEINAHGGIVVTNKILDLILANGARLAERGEFTKRAFLNGRLTLEKAEAINGLIHAKTNIQAEIAISQFDSHDQEVIQDLENQMLAIMATIETNIDYSEYYDIPQIDNKKLQKEVEIFIEKLDEIIKKSELAQDIYQGIKVAIVGKPNVGKSSLLNALLDKPKAIVTNIAGTTRDVIEAEFTLNGLLFQLVDTAGIRKTKERIENIGIKRTKQAIKEAKIIIHLRTAKEKEDEEYRLIKKLAKNKVYLSVISKIDLVKDRTKFKDIIISAKKGYLWELRSALVDAYSKVDLDDKKIIYNERQLSLLKKCRLNLEEASKGLKKDFGPEVVIVDLTKAWENLREILNKEHDNEALLDKIFSKFCLGK
ncbi:tRNA modification GTPase [Metamycoplasma subdolum]|uniref:tRNA modification GTPase MnmE n=1 Tax=Metamycoplasma subdolum TaxID=92407 RepID=A0A3M0A175_9BACT|nr:tRNA uridine-5-carboxymethylaminomethyl(34) synthesis GTPase MnmE [Metamycoplasma subdolum]RMA78540.1 tRNA modification GTPase [Metamycoplasma subdolum]WPB50472.1 tRNA uridine-5-carboxymethylaminomethyl(34) synthesis GTPase MnmE [Metamycoplasma subdolum]